MSMLYDDGDTVDSVDKPMLYEDGYIYPDVFVSKDSLTFEQGLAYHIWARDIENASAEQLKSFIESYLRQLVNRIRLVRVYKSREKRLDLTQPFEVDPPVEVEFAIRPTLTVLDQLSELQEVSEEQKSRNLERLKQYLLTLRLVDFRIPTLRYRDG